MKHRFLCCNQETYTPLIWMQYGYWHYDKRNKKLYPPPEWFNIGCLERCIDLVKHLKEPDLKIKVTVEFGKDSYLRPDSWGASWVLYDPNNPHIEHDKGSVTGCKTEQDARAYAMQRYRDLKRLYDGDVEAMLVYKKTGVACLPNWNTNEIDSWGYKLVNGKIVKSRIPRAREVKA